MVKNDEPFHRKPLPMTLRALASVSLLALVASPVLAADPSALPQRVDRLEKEMKAVQRKVFPGGSPAFFEPEIAPPPADAAPAGTPATQPIKDLTARVDGLEQELTRITRQVEESQHRLDVLSQAAAKDRSDFDARLKALEGVAPPIAAPGAAPVQVAPPAPPAGRKPGRPVEKGPDVAAAPPAETAPAPAVASSGDPAEDAYMAGYKLWEQKKYEEAEAVLAKVAKQYPKHKRASYARNLLGRAQLDAGTPAMAAQTFYSNYQTDPRGERAPDSLFYLGQALVQLKKPADACKAYGELEQVYGATLAAGLKSRLPAAKKAANCS